MTDQRPERVRVTSPRTGRPRHTSVAAEIDRQSEIGEVYMRSLMRAQFRLALAVVAVLAVTVGSLPLLFRGWPALRRVEILGIPLPWLLLGFLVYPLLIALAWFYVRRAERNERDFDDLVGPR
ncbi:MAG TPA: hypothetical protein VFO98_13995 [Marmoricola sp.]|jgi:cation transporter-like permease|nr:hypothetical protein [Marmoricola sp.]